MIRDDFPAITESTPLVEELRGHIERDGPMTFREFMARALYHPRHGYYSTLPGATSRGGDYVTSPEVHPIFGALVGRQIEELWRLLGSPARFDVVEPGAGRGLLARDIVRRAAETAPEFGRALRYTIVERQPRLIAAQREAIDELGDAAGAVAWRDDLPDSIAGVVLSNELLDAFPVHRVVRRGDELLEVYVDLDERGRFVDLLRAPSTFKIPAYFQRLAVQPGDGCYAEVNLDAPWWMARAAKALRRGYVLTFDYGYEAAELYAPWRRDGTLLCLYRQSASSDPYQRTGKQDMTASVDFTTVRAAGEGAGLRTVGQTDQASFLMRLGIGESLARVASAADASMEEYFARRRVVLDLIDPARVGRITVLLQGRDAPDVTPRGFRDG